MAAIPMQWKGRRFLVETDDVTVIAPTRRPTVEHGDLPDSLEPVAARIPDVDFKEVVDFVADCANAVFDAMERLVQPDEASIEFAVKVAGEMGVPVLTKLSSEGTIKVTVTWKKPESKNRDGRS
jgi:Trypsin-co-occurring domain 1